MTPISQAHADAVMDRLVLLAGLAQRFNQSHAAKSFWNVHLERLGVHDDPTRLLPGSLVRLAERPEPNIGVVVSGLWDRRLGDWDLTHRFLLVMVDGTIAGCESALGEQVDFL